jgi:hypothetical protein
MKKMKKLFLIAIASIFSSGAIAQDTTDCALFVNFSYTVDDDNIYFTNTSTGEPLGPIYSWTIDGLTSALENPTFSRAGFEATETVCFTVHDAPFECAGERCELIDFEMLDDSIIIIIDSTDCLLSTSFTYTVAGDMLYLTNTSTGEPADANYSWSVDGLYSSEENPSFSTLGFEAYEEVCLTVYDSVESCFGTYCELIYLDGDTIIDSTDCLLNASFTIALDGGMLNLFNTSTGEPFGAFYNWSVDGLYSSEENPSFSTADFEATEEVCLTVYDSSEFCIDTYCLTLAFEDDSVIVVDSTAGIFSAEKVSMELFPNPVKDVLTIKVSNSNGTKQVNVYSAYGELVRVEQIARENSQIILDLTDLTNGIYIVTIIDEENPDLIIREKLIKN